MTTKKTSIIRLLNKTFEIKCPEEESDNLQLAAQKLNQELTENKNKFKHLDEFHTLLLAALNISHQLIACQKQHDQQRHQVTEFISSLENKIHQVVNGNQEPEMQGN